jgi:hypothetical protein
MLVSMNCSCEDRVLAGPALGEKASKGRNTANAYTWSPFPQRWARPGPGPHSFLKVRARSATRAHEAARQRGADPRDTIQGYLAHTKTPTPLGPPLNPRHRPTVGF